MFGDDNRFAPKPQLPKQENPAKSPKMGESIIKGPIIHVKKGEKIGHYHGLHIMAHIPKKIII